MIRRVEPGLRYAFAGLAGWAARLLRWFSDSGVVADPSDSLAVEANGTPIPEVFTEAALRCTSTACVISTPNLATSGISPNWQKRGKIAGAVSAW